ncbi:hypothetical protein CYY_009485 [Polysphondylium violaceum]|uniref:MYND-type domain-containing protein n=1 Tax=Polysphondylium violaceum TaxID=133409 RepID=A0A8J4UVZ4_9MYCE|nr:hypothetical protein CYY_009485 [Polysphondylium violaceum]
MDINTDNQNKRHCAFCLKEIQGNEIKRCGKCQARAYCSRECQVDDWSGKGQNHKLWCDERVCEEDIDWDIRIAEGKGLGLFAKRDIPRYTKILVDKGYHSRKEVPQPLLESLMPHSGSLAAKWDFNNMYSSEGGENLGVRVSRLNHDCNNNATFKYIPDLKVFIIVSIVDIAKDQEITIQYQSFNDVSKDAKYRNVRLMILNEKWGIKCQADCVCRDKAVRLRIEKAHQVDKVIPSLLKFAENDIKAKLKVIDDNIEVIQELGGCPISLIRPYYDGFQIAILNQKTVPLSTKYIDKLIEYSEIINSKHSEEHKTFLKYKENPRNHRNYCLKNI